MKIAIATPVLFDKASPFNHLFKAILGGFLDAGNEIVRYVACRDEREDGYKYGYDENSQKIQYVKFVRKESDHGNIISRYIRDTLTNIKEANAIQRSDADVLFEDVSYSSFWAVRAAKKKGMRVVAMLQDVWPDNAVQSGLIGQRGLLYRYFEAWQRYVYRKADRIICISDDMKGFIISKGVPAEKITIIYNWGYSDKVVDIPWEENKFVKKYELNKQIFYAVYAGNIGKMQNVELVVDAAKELQNDDRIRFLIIGDGARREEIKKRAEGVRNIQLFPLQPSEIAIHIYSAAGVNIIPLVEGGPKTAMPSKTGVVLSCGKPVIFAFGKECEFARIVHKYNAGSCVSASNASELARAVKECSENKSENGTQQLFADMFTKTDGVERYVNAISAL